MAERLIQTPIGFTAEQKAELDRVSAEDGISISEFVRRAVDAALVARRAGRQQPAPAPSIKAIVLSSGESVTASELANFVNITPKKP